MSGERWRIVTTTNGHVDVSAIALSQEEAQEQLEGEALIAAIAGWNVTPGAGVIVCSRGSTTRTVEARCFDPLNDHQRNQEART